MKNDEYEFVDGEKGIQVMVRKRENVTCEWCEKETPNDRHHAWSIVSNETFEHLYWLCTACHSYGTGINTLEATKRSK